MSRDKSNAKEEGIMPKFEPVTVTIKGPHNSGRTTLANLIKMMLEENSYKNVVMNDTSPLPTDEKDRFAERFDRNRALRTVQIHVETIE